MESQHRYDLNTAIAAWLKELGKHSLPTEMKRELEQHLRDSITALLNSGVTEEKAFVAASERIGKPADLAREFNQCNGRLWTRKMQALAVLALCLCGLWLWSHVKESSIGYAWANGAIMAGADRGVFQLEIVRRDASADARHKDDFLYSPTKGFEERGFEINPHRRQACTGLRKMRFEETKTWFGKLCAKQGIASWPYEFQAGFFGPSCFCREIFLPCWLFVLLIGSPLATKLALRWRCLRTLKRSLRDQENFNSMKLAHV